MIPDASREKSAWLIRTSLDGVRAADTLSVYAEPVGGHAERVWYFSSEGESPSFAAQPANTQVLERAVRLAGAHRPGRYRVHVFLADRALRRDEMLADTSAPGVRAQLQTDLTVLEH